MKANWEIGIWTIWLIAIFVFRAWAHAVATQILHAPKAVRSGNKRCLLYMLCMDLLYFDVKDSQLRDWKKKQMDLSTWLKVKGGIMSFSYHSIFNRIQPDSRAFVHVFACAACGNIHCLSPHSIQLHQIISNSNNTACCWHVEWRWEIYKQKEERYDFQLFVHQSALLVDFFIKCNDDGGKSKIINT